MASVRSSSTEEQSFWAQFAELAWLDHAISFIFKLIAILAEPFLAAGLIASAVDYGSHGHFLETNDLLMMAWIATQAIALEGSGGVALAMSFESQAQNDPIKAWMQRCLALTLMAVGGVMFFSEMSAAAPGFKAVMTSPQYVYIMAGLRTVVSLWYIAVCRTKSHRYSGVEPAQSPSPAPNIEAELARLVEEQIGDVRSDIEDLRNAISGQVKEIPAQISKAVAAQEYEVDPDKLSAQVAQSVEQAMRTLDLSAQIKDQVQRVVAMAMMRPTAQAQKNTDELMQSLSGKETMKIPSIGEEAEKKQRVQRYVAEQRGQGHEPTLEDIMAECRVAKNTASKYRKTVGVAS
jgi:hypothetical protein